MKTLIATYLLVIITLPSFSQDDLMKQGICANIDWIWGAAGNAPPSRAEVWLYPVVIGANGEYPSIRGPVGARTCGNYAVLYALSGNNRAAIAWLKSAQGHNPAAANDFEIYSDFTIAYAVSKHKNDALIEAGLGQTITDAVRIKDIISKKLSGHNPNPNSGLPRGESEPKEPRDPGGNARRN